MLADDQKGLGMVALGWGGGVENGFIDPITATRRQPQVGETPLKGDSDSYSGAGAGRPFSSLLPSTPPAAFRRSPGRLLNRVSRLKPPFLWLVHHKLFQVLSTLVSNSGWDSPGLPGANQCRSGSPSGKDAGNPGPIPVDFRWSGALMEHRKDWP